jgi:hypothetical protein
MAALQELRQGYHSRAGLFKEHNQQMLHPMICHLFVQGADARAAAGCATFAQQHLLSDESASEQEQGISTG